MAEEAAAVAKMSDDEVVNVSNSSTTTCARSWTRGWTSTPRPGARSTDAHMSWSSRAPDGSEDQYNRSFVGFVPEGQVPVQHINALLDWNKILVKKS